MKFTSPPIKQAFSLVELSMVLIILGLLVGTVLTGRSLIHAAELRKHIAETNNLRATIQVFKEKYLALPGDMPNTTQFWPTASCNGGTSTGNCYGDGNGKIDGVEAPVRVWKHLSLAGLIPGTYSGWWAPGVNIGEEIPPSPLGKNLGWVITTLTPYTPAGYYGHLDGTYLFTARYPYTTTNYNGDYVGTLLPEDVYNIDMKVDDGNGLTGAVATWNYTYCVNASGVYNLAGTQNLCWFWHKIL